MKMQAKGASRLDFDLLSKDGLANPWGLLRPIREQEPVFWSDIQNAWLITRHEDIKLAYKDKRFSVARMRFFVDRLTEQVEGGLPLVEKYVPLIVNFIDPPALNRVRMLMFQAFQPKNVENMRAAIRTVVADMLDKAQALGTFDFMKEIAVEIPIRMLMKVLGVPEVHRPEFLELVSANGEALGSSQPTPQTMRRFEEALKRSFKVFSALVAEREKEAKPDFLSVLVHARDNDDRLSHDELLVACFTIMAAGVETTAGALGVFLRTIAQHDHLSTYIREKPAKIRNVIDELNRYPSEVKGMLRVAAEDFDWGGKRIREGDMVYLMHAAGNTDPTVFTNPFEIDPERNTQQSFGWGTGFHSCIGQLLAKAELDEFLAECFTRFKVEVLQDDIEFSRSFALTVYKRLQVRFTPLAAAEAGGAAPTEG
jgi:cytochrome P450